jgi:hypothetical protein
MASYVHDLLTNWGRFVKWGSTGLPRNREVCISYEWHYANHNSRFQYEGRAPRPIEPNHADGRDVERIVCDPEFPAIWRKVLKVEYVTHRFRVEGESDEQFLAAKARAAGVSSWRSYWDFLNGAHREVAQRFGDLRRIYVVVDEGEGA